MVIACLCSLLRRRTIAPGFNAELDPLFADVNLPVNWRAIFAAGSSVSRVYVSNNGPLKLGGILLPWFTCDGAPVCHHADRAADYPGAHLRHPQRGDSVVTVDRASRDDLRHPWKSEAQIQEYQPRGRVKLTLPAYNVARGYLLLDGAHRSIATLRAGVEYIIELVVIPGPVDQRVLPDLAGFE